ncbi:MAG TPA: hypothetical protein VHL57_05895 [Flavobacteriales bacterium]|jgi:hypothetical protein|nr:hypothetical protein [Flavobacteriales bacterium]
MEHLPFLDQVVAVLERSGYRIVLPKCDQELNDAIPANGLVIFHAPWSMYSCKNLGAIAATVRKCRKALERIVIVPVDDISSQTSISILGVVPQGYAEAVLLRNGKVQVAHRRSTDLEQFLAALSQPG